MSLFVERLDKRLALAAQQYWVSLETHEPNGSSLGSFDNPFPSLESAQQAIREEVPQQNDIVILIEGGTYEIDQPLVFTPQDSGRDGYTITWAAVPGETVVLSGSRQATGWTKVENPGLVSLALEGNTLWKADVSSLSVSGRPDFRVRQLYVDGLRGTIAETMPSAMPEDEDPTYPYGFRPLFGEQASWRTPDEPIFDWVNGIVFSDPSSLGNPNDLDWRYPETWDMVEGVADASRQKDIEAVARMQWREFKVPIEQIHAYDESRRIDVDFGVDGISVGFIEMQADPWRAATLDFGLGPEKSPPPVPSSSTAKQLAPNPSDPAIWSPWRISQFTNSYQFLDQQNEWYYDHVGKNVYLVCGAFDDPNLMDIQIPVTETLMQLTGTAETPIQNLAIEGITFSGATWLDPSFGEGYVPDQAGIQIDGGTLPGSNGTEYLNGLTTTGHSKFTQPTPGNVQVAYAHDVTFRGNVFANLGGVGLAIGRGSQGVDVEGNTFTSISSSAITVGGVSWARVDPSISPSDESKWIIDKDKKITAHGTDAFPDHPADHVNRVLIRKNSISGTGEDYVDAPGILVGFAQNTVIEDNAISDTSWSGIQVGWGWGLLDKERFPGQPNSVVSSWLPHELGEPTSLRNTRIQGNVFRDFINEVYDGGAIYTSGAQGTHRENGTHIVGNVMFAKRPKGGGNVVYTDGGSRYVTIAENLLFDNPRGEFWMGADFSLLDQLNETYFGLPLLQYADWLSVHAPILDKELSFYYGSQIGGCIPAGDFLYQNNIWESWWPARPKWIVEKNPSGYPLNPLFYNPAVPPYDTLTKLTPEDFQGNTIFAFDSGAALHQNGVITDWLDRHGYGTTWNPPGYPFGWPGNGGEVVRPSLSRVESIYLGTSMQGETAGGPQPVVMSKSQVVGDDVAGFVITAVAGDSVVEKWLESSQRWVDVSTVPTSSNPRELLQLLENRTIFQGDKIRWRPQKNETSAKQRVFELLNWDLGMEVLSPLPTNVPTAVLGLAVTPLGTGGVKLTWGEPVSGKATSYTITLKITTATGTVHQTEITRDRFIEFSSLSDDGLAEFSVIASNAEGRSGPASFISYDFDMTSAPSGGIV